MTSGVKQALPQFLLTKTNADKQSFRTRANDRDFGDALATAKAGKQNAPGKHVADAEPHWPRFGTKLDAAIDRTSGLAPKLSLKVAEPDSRTSRRLQKKKTSRTLEQKPADNRRCGRGDLAPPARHPHSAGASQAYAGRRKERANQRAGRRERHRNFGRRQHRRARRHSSRRRRQVQGSPWQQRWFFARHVSRRQAGRRHA